MSFLNDYVDVKERIALFYERYPNGSLQFEFKGTLESNPAFIWGIAYAYRTPYDPRPGMGTAAELAEGKTTFSRGSELMVLETSAWGRCLGSLGIGLQKGIATAQEVEAAVNRWETPVSRAAETPSEPGPMTEKQYNLIKSMFNYSFHDMTSYVDEFKQRFGLKPDAKLSTVMASTLIDELKAAGKKPTRKPLIDQESKD